MIDYNKLFGNNTYVIDTYSRVMNYTLYFYLKPILFVYKIYVYIKSYYNKL